MTQPERSDSRLIRAALALDAETMQIGMVRGDDAIEQLGVDHDEFGRMMKNAFNQSVSFRVEEVGDPSLALKLTAMDLFTYGVRLGMLLEREPVE